MISPFSLPPHPLAQTAAKEVTDRVHAYMDAHPESELHRQGKMFGVLVYSDRQSSIIKNEVNRALAAENNQLPITYLSAFSAMLDGSYHHEGFVPPVYEPDTMPIGTTREESQRLQRLLFANYRFTNRYGETKSLLEIFANEKPILSEDDFFNKSQIANHKIPITNPPSGAGDCCAPKLLNYALTHGLQPVCLAEFWVGAPAQNEVRREGCFYAPCSGRCVPILRHMLQGIEVISDQPSTDHFQIETLYEDDYLIVINKPSGLLSVPGKKDEPSIESSFQHSPFNFQFIKAVHRLDQDTSGLLVLAKTPEVYKTLQAYFQRRDILKRYEAVVRPQETNDHSPLTNNQSEGEINLPLLPNPYDRPRQMVDFAHGKPAFTKYKVRERRTDGTVLVDFFPLTGRTHQLRVHAAHPQGLNAPIVGDRLYGQITNHQSQIINRLLLHAAEIAFLHPVTKEEMHFCIPSNF